MPGQLETANQRTYEPSLRELTSQVSALEKLFDAKHKNILDIVAERDRLYKERADSADKAISKAEESQKAYNASHNDLARKMEAQYALMMPRTESQVKWHAVDGEMESIKHEVGINRNDRQIEIAGLRIELMKEIQSLRESRSKGGGVDEAQAAGLMHKQWSIGTMIAALAVFASFVAVIVAVVAMVKH